MRFVFEPAQQTDQSEILDLFREPMAGSISLALERDPDYFAGALVQNEKPAVFVGRDTLNNRITGLFSAGTRHVFVNGERTEIPYFCDLRIHRDYQNGTLLARGYRFVRQELLKERYAQTLIVSDNERALASLTGGRAGLPVYYPFGRYTTFALPRVRRRRALAVTRAGARDLEEIQAFILSEGRMKQFFPAYDLQLESPHFSGLSPSDFFLVRGKDGIIGMCGVWNQKAFKRTRLVSYSPFLRMVRPFYNALTGIRGGVPLPNAGEVLDYSFLHCILVKENDPAVLSSLLSAVFAAEDQTCSYFLMGLDAQDPLTRAVRGIPYRAFHGLHFLVSGASDPRPALRPGPFYLEAARI